MLATGGTGAANAPLRTRWRERGTLLTGAALLLVAALAWIVVVAQTTGAGMAMPMAGASLADAGGFVVAWGVMMVAMMLPSATPMIALYRAVARNASRTGQQVVPTALFAATYLVVWLLLGVPVYLVGVGVAGLAAVPTVARWLPDALALVLLAAGLYQFTAVKRVCLRYCRTPLTFLLARWRPGYAGTLRLGAAHAWYCVGCCWGLMAVLVAAGAMSLPWVLLIAVVVFVEKLVPGGERAARIAGVALVLLAVAVALRPEVAVALRGGPLDTMSSMGT